MIPVAFKRKAFNETFLRSAIALAATASIAGCGGGGGSDTAVAATPTTVGAEGLWTGTASGNRSFVGAVLDNGDYWFLYSVAGNPGLAAGAVQGSSSMQKVRFRPPGAATSPNSRHYYR